MSRVLMSKAIWLGRRWRDRYGIVHETFPHEIKRKDEGTLYERRGICGVAVSQEALKRTIEAVEIPNDEELVTCFGCLTE